MRVTLFTFMLSLLVCTGFSQTSLRPSEILADLKEEGEVFTTYQPFSPTVSVRNDDYAEICEDCSIFSLDQNILNRMLGQQAEFLRLQLPGKGLQSIELEMYKVDLFNGSFKVETSDGQIFEKAEDSGIHYRGMLKGEESSLAALSIYEEQVMLLISSPSRGNWTLGKLEDQSGDYIFYESEKLDNRHSFDCATEDSYRPYRPEELNPQTGLRSANSCVKIYLEIDNDIVTDKGGVDPTVDFIVGVFNEVAILYANENIKIELSKLFLWTGTSPYSANNSYDMLRQFQSTRTSIDGDLGQLLSYQASGGIAIVNGLCQSRTEYKLSFSSINRSYRQVPTYSFTVMVIAHELGHLFGSQHTHACVWNGNSTAIDGCAGFVEGNCATPGLPSDGGTIMSYCHITGVGINLARGFGPQPGNVMRNRVAGASCLQACSTGNDNGNGNGDGNDNNGDCVDVSLDLTLDLFGTETSWELRDEQGNLIESGGGYDNKKNGQKINSNFCLTAGCYSLIVKDTDGDGLCCEYGQGGYEITDAEGNVLVSGGQFEFEVREEFCIEGTGGDDDDNDDDAGCTSIDFNTMSIISYGGSQDAGNATLIDGGKGVVLNNNAWKAIDLPYEVTPQTVLRFEFRSSRRPEIAGIGFDENRTISSARTFMLYGSQNWGIRNYKNYSGNGQWQTYEIPVGNFYQGAMNYLFFAGDHDRSPRNGDAQFRNIFIYEGNPCSNMPQVFPNTQNLSPERTVSVYPNPADQEVFFEIQGQVPAEASIELYNMFGQQIRTTLVEEAGVIRIMTNDLPNGTYLYRLSGFESEYSGKFSVHR